MDIAEIRYLLAEMNDAELKYKLTLNTDKARELFLEFIKQLRAIK